MMPTDDKSYIYNVGMYFVLIMLKNNLYFIFTKTKELGFFLNPCSGASSALQGLSSHFGKYKNKKYIYLTKLPSQVTPTVSSLSNYHCNRGGKLLSKSKPALIDIYCIYYFCT